MYFKVTDHTQQAANHSSSTFSLESSDERRGPLLIKPFMDDI